VRRGARGRLPPDLGRGGIGFALAPTLTLVLPAPVVLALIAPLMNLSDPFVLRYFWRRWDAGQLRVLLPTMLAGVVLGAWVLSRLSPFWMEKTIAGIALIFGLSQIVLTGRGVRLMPGGAHWTVGALAGLLAGIASMLAHSAGIILGLYLVNVSLTPPVVVATGSALMVFANAVKLLGYWQLGFLTWEIVGAALLAVPLLAAGAWLGERTNRRLPRRAFELALAAIAIAGALRLLLRG